MNESLYALPVEPPEVTPNKTLKEFWAPLFAKERTPAGRWALFSYLLDNGHLSELDARHILDLLSPKAP